MQNAWTIIFGLVSLIISAYGADISALELDSECELMGLVGSVLDFATVCNDLLSITCSQTASSSAVVSGETSTVTSSVTDVTTLTSTFTSTMYNTLSFSATTTDTVTETNYTTSYIVSTSTITTTTGSSRDRKKRQETIIENNTINVEATVDIVVLDLETPTTEGVYVLVSKTFVPSNSLITPSSSNIIYTTAAPTFLSELIDNKLVSVKSEVGSILGAIYTKLELAAEYAMELETFCSCVSCPQDVTAAEYLASLTASQTTITETTTISVTKIAYTTITSVADTSLTATTTSTTTTTSVSTAMETCTNIVLDPDFASTIAHGNRWSSVGSLVWHLAVPCPSPYASLFCLEVANSNATESQTISQGLTTIKDTMYTYSFMWYASAIGLNTTVTIQNSAQQIFVDGIRFNSQTWTAIDGTFTATSTNTTLYFYILSETFNTAEVYFTEVVVKCSPDQD